MLASYMTQSTITQQLTVLCMVQIDLYRLASSSLLRARVYQCLLALYLQLSHFLCRMLRFSSALRISMRLQSIYSYLTYMIIIISVFVRCRHRASVSVNGRTTKTKYIKSKSKHTKVAFFEWLFVSLLFSQVINIAFLTAFSRPQSHPILFIAGKSH